MYNRAALKQQAKDSLSGKWGKVVGIVIVFWLITMILAYVNILPLIPAIFALAQTGELSLETLIGLSSSTGALSLITGVLASLISVSFALSFLHFVDRQDQDIIQELTAPYVRGKAWGTIMNWLLTEVFTHLWTFLFVIPGIIKRYSYAMSYYITEDWGNQGYNVKGTEAINASKEMMRGHKWELFVLDLSFIGWYILVFFTGGLAGLFVTPYHAATRAAYYRDLLSRQAQTAQTYAPTNAPMQGAPAQAAPTGYAPAQNFAPYQAQQGYAGYTPAAEQAPTAQAQYAQQPYVQQPVQTAQPTQPAEAPAPTEPAHSAAPSTTAPAQTTNPTEHTDFGHPEIPSHNDDPYQV
ncbi:DUF975 family protein [Alloscardovia omnicolens]|uniref:DUF975 family protein n=1 Tax=Alloscardovia omnicolens TaxID=419015 RepID=UPI003A6A3898